MSFWFIVLGLVQASIWLDNWLYSNWMALCRRYVMEHIDIARNKFILHRKKIYVVKYIL